jgi:lysozyme
MGLLVAFSAWAWFGWLPNSRPALRLGERYGVDVSAHQGAIDWDRVVGDSISFAYIKATEGGDFVDERFTVNWAGARRAGIEVGVYHFFTLCTPGDVQARNFVGAAPPDGAAMPPAVDLELAGNCSVRPDPGTVQHELASFLTVTGQVPKIG